MLATFNLQFSPVEITDDSFLTSTMTPDVAPTADFAELLKLRVQPAEGPGAGTGQDLPQAGSELPLQALAVELDAPASSELNVLPHGIPIGVTSQGDLPVHESGLTPALVKRAADQPQPAALASELDPTIAVTRAPAAGDPLASIGGVGREAAPPQQSRPLPVIQSGVTQPTSPADIQQTVATLAGKIDPATHVPREPVLPAQPVVADVDKSMPIVELPRRVEASPLPAINVEDVGELVKARPTVTPPVQVLNVQPNPQQAALVAAAPNVATTDSGFAAAVQQASDLISVPVRDTAWAEQIGERVLLMAGKQMTSAEIRLTPAELGPLRIQVSVDDGAANVTFQAQHAVTREAIEQALPRLRELLAESGLSLGQASVGEQGVAEGKRDERSTSPDAVPGEALEGEEPGESAGPQRVVKSDSLVDTFV